MKMAYMSPCPDALLTLRQDYESLRNHMAHVSNDARVYILPTVYVVSKFLWVKTAFLQKKKDMSHSIDNHAIFYPLENSRADDRSAVVPLGEHTQMCSSEQRVQLFDGQFSYDRELVLVGLAVSELISRITSPDDETDMLRNRDLRPQIDDGFLSFNAR